MNDYIEAGQDFEVAFYVPLVTGGYAAGSDLIDITAKVYGLSGTPYGEYSLKNPAGTVKPITEVSREFSIMLTSAQTLASTGEELRLQVVPMWVTSSGDGRNGDPYIVTLPKVETPTQPITQ